MLTSAHAKRRGEQVAMWHVHAKEWPLARCRAGRNSLTSVESLHGNLFSSGDRQPSDMQPQIDKRLLDTDKSDRVKTRSRKRPFSIPLLEPKSQSV